MRTRRTDRSTRLRGALRALADPTRLKIMLMLEGKRRTVGEIVDFFALSQPTISRHLQALAAVGLVKRQKAGTRVYYALNPDRLSAVCIELAVSFPCCCLTVTRPQKRRGKSRDVVSAESDPAGQESTGTGANHHVDP